MTSISLPSHQTWKLSNASAGTGSSTVDLADAVAAQRLEDALLDADRRLPGPCGRRVEEPDGHALLEPLGQVLSLAVGLPAAERREAAVGDVPLGLAVADEAHVGGGGHPAAERLRELQLPR